MQTYKIDHKLRNGELTSQETRMLGGSDFVEGAKIGKPWTPLAIVLGGERSLAEINEARIQQGFFSPGITLRAVLPDVNGVFSVEPLDENGVTVRDPQLYVYDPISETLTHSSELTEKYYVEFERLLLQEEKPGEAAYMYTIFHREKPSHLEKEGGSNKES